MGNWKHLLQVTTLAVVASACGTSSSTSVNAPSARCAVTATAQPARSGLRRVRVDHRAHRPRMRVGSAQRVDWLALSDSSGRGDGSMRYTAAGNPVVSRAARRRRRQRIAGRDRTGGGGVRLQPRSVAAAVSATGGRIDVSVSTQRAARGRRATTPRGSPSRPARPARAPGRSRSRCREPHRAGAIQRRHHRRPALRHRAGGRGHRRPGPTTAPAPRPPGCALTVSPLTASVGARAAPSRCVSPRPRATCSWTAARECPGS